MDSQIASVVDRPGGDRAEAEQMSTHPATEEGPRERLMEAMLEACGKEGYGPAALAMVRAERAGARLGDFFAGSEDCFAAAYAAHAEALCERLLGSARVAADDRGGLEAAICGLAEFIETEPERARSIFAEVHVAGPRASAERARLLDRMGAVLDRAYRDPSSSAPAPAGTGAFLVAMVESIALRACLDRDPARLDGLAPEIAAMVEAAYASTDPLAP